MMKWRTEWQSKLGTVLLCRGASWGAPAQASVCDVEEEGMAVGFHAGSAERLACRVAGLAMESCLSGAVRQAALAVCCAADCVRPPVPSLCKTQSPPNVHRLELLRQQLAEPAPKPPSPAPAHCPPPLQAGAAAAAAGARSCQVAALPGAAGAARTAQGEMARWQRCQEQRAHHALCKVGCKAFSGQAGAVA